MAWKDSRLVAPAFRTALPAAVFTFAAETELERDAFELAKLRFEQPRYPCADAANRILRL